MSVLIDAGLVDNVQPPAFSIIDLYRSGPTALQYYTTLSRQGKAKNTANESDKTDSLRYMFITQQTYYICQAEPLTLI